MTVKQVMDQLEEYGDEKTKKTLLKHGDERSNSYEKPPRILCYFGNPHCLGFL